MNNIFTLKKGFKKMALKCSRFLGISALFFCLAGTAFAQVEITEIMYDLKEGSDTGREWVEIHNVGADSVDVSSWRFFEAETNHKLKPISGNGTLSAGEYAIIVSDNEKFHADNPSFSGSVLESSFSLSNTGESLSLRNADLNDIDSVTYSADLGANGDGNSLQKVNGSWCAGVPTVGATNVSVCAEKKEIITENSTTEKTSNETTQEQEQPTAHLSTAPSWAEELKISAYAGASKRFTIAGANISFKGQSHVEGSESLPFVQYIWNFGDGSREEGEKVTHTYYYPGEYTVVLNVVSGKYSATEQVLVEVSPADILISKVSFVDPFFIEIYNKTLHELDLSQWKLKAGTQNFAIPQDTFVKSNKKIIFPSEITKLSLKEGDEISLLYPSGKTVTTYDEKNDTGEVISLPISDVLNKVQEVNSTSNHIEEKSVTESTPKKVKSGGSSLPQKYVSLGKEEEVKGEELVVPDAVGINQEASVLDGVENKKENKEGGLFWGIMGVSLVSLIAIYGVLVSKEKENFVQIENGAGTYKIIEIKD